MQTTICLRYNPQAFSGSNRNQLLRSGMMIYGFRRQTYNAFLLNDTSNQKLLQFVNISPLSIKCAANNRITNTYSNKHTPENQPNSNKYQAIKPLPKTHSRYKND